MKLLISFLFLLLLVSCQPQAPKNKIIIHVEAIIDSSPDSAYNLLTSIAHPEKLVNYDYAAWCLNYSQAQFKLKKEVKSDSLILRALNYYKNSQLKKYSGKAYFLWGCYAQKHHDNKLAMKALKIADLLIQETADNNLKGLIDFRIGYCYMEDDLFNESLLYFKKSLNQFILSKDKHYQAYTYRAISDIYLKLNHPFQQVMNYNALAIRLSKEAGDPANYYANLSRRGEIIFDKNLEASNKYLLQGFRFSPLNHYGYAAFLATNYSKLNKLDSAKYYLQIALSDTSKTRPSLSINIAAAYVSKAEGNYIQSFHYLEKAYNLRDTIIRKTMNNQLIRIDKQYDLTQKEKENEVLKIANRNEIILISLLVIGLLVLSIIVHAIKSNNKKMHALHLLEKQQLEFDKRTSLLENLKKREILMEKLQNKTENTLRLSKLKKGILQKDKHETFMKDITRQSILQESEWPFYIDEVNGLFENRITILKDRFYELTLADLIVVAMICMKVTIPDSCILLDMQKKTLYHRRQVIKKRLSLNTEDDLEIFLEQNIMLEMYL